MSNLLLWLLAQLCGKQSAYHQHLINLNSNNNNNNNNNNDNKVTKTVSMRFRIAC